MKVAAIQHDIVWEDGAATRTHVAPLIAQAAGAGARLVVLSEMFATGFSMAPERVAEPQGGDSERFLREKAREHNLWLLGSIAQWPASERPAAGEAANPALARSQQELAANVAVLAGPDGQLHRYTKIHPFSYGEEHLHYVGGSQFLTVAIEDVRVSVFICYDLRFADEFWQLATDTDLYVIPANWPERRREHWRTLLRARAIENLAYVLGCNRVGVAGHAGSAPQIEHCGDSAIIDPLGRTLTEASLIEAVLIADIDPLHVQQVRQRFGFLVDRR